MLVRRATLVVLSCWFGMSACSGDRGEKGSSCSVSKTDAGTEITCEDGTSTVLPGTTASACTVTSNDDGSSTIKCGDKTTTVASGKSGDKGDKGDKGDPGDQGAQGEPGSTGDDGRSAYVVGAGLVVEILSVTVPNDRQAVATLRIRDGAEHPLDRSGKFTPGAVNISFVLAHLNSTDGKVGEYTPYYTASVDGATVGNVAPAMPNATQPRSENDGTWTETDASMGMYTYQFKRALPEDYDKGKTHTLAIYASRTFDGATYVSNPVFHFRPDGQDVTEKREIVSTAACNACHNTLRVHGGSRREVGLCITCHVEGMSDPESGNSIDMVQLIHKIHRGEDLPSVVGGTAYKIVGFNNSVHDYSHVVFPQPLENCETCHQGGADSDRWKTTLTRYACGSCHDDISFTSPAPNGMKLHAGGPQMSDSLCATCHSEGMGPLATLESDVVKVHAALDEFPLRDLTSGAIISAPPALTGSIVSVTGTGPAEAPVVRFTVAVNGEPYDILASGKELNRLRFTFAGPTTDYAGYVQYTAQGTGAVGTLAAGSTAGEFTWTVAGGVTMTTIATACNTQPAGSFAVGMEGRMTAMATRPNATNTSVNYPMHNKVAYFAVTDAEAVPRREAVIVENCNHCHQDLGAHGGSRNDPEYCVLCHSANKDATDIPAPAVGDTKLTASVRLSHMIHRIHTGENGTDPYIIGSHDFTEVLFPGDRQNCLNCHVKSHYALPLPNLLPTHLTQIDSNNARVPSTDYYMQATAAACTGCHDSESTITHTEVMTTALGATGDEACASCHGANTAYDVDVVHATPGL